MSTEVNVAEMSPQQVSDLLAQRKIVLVDVREPNEYAAERIRGALLYPLSTFNAAFLPTDDSRPVVFHCGGGMRSLTAATQRLTADGKATHMKGGLRAWKAAGLPTVSIDPATGKLKE